MNRDHFVIFEIASKYCISDSFVDHHDYCISSKGFLPAVVDIMVIHPFQSILVHRFLECWHALLPSPVWPLPICLDSWTWHSRFLCNIALYSIRPWLLSPVTSTAGYCFYFCSIPSFFLKLFLHWSPVAYWAPTNLGISSFSVLSFCLFILFMGLNSKTSEVACHSFLQWTTFCQKSPLWLTPFDGPAQYGLWLHWVRRGCGPCDQIG